MLSGGRERVHWKRMDLNKHIWSTSSTAKNSQILLKNYPNFQMSILSD